jgi:hypothetical protein
VISSNCCQEAIEKLWLRVTCKRRLFSCIAFICYFSTSSAIAENRYGEWFLEQPRSSVLTLTFKQSVLIDNKIATSELGFVCDQSDKSGIVGTLIPFEGTFENRQSVIPVLFQNNSERYDPSDLLQHWRNGAAYIFLETKDDVDELASFLKSNDNDGVKTVHVFFPQDVDAGPQISNHVVITVSGFSERFGAFQAACSPLR